jgi:hypothetical protein
MRAQISTVLKAFLLVAAAGLAPQARGAETTYDFVACTSSKVTMLEARAELTAFGVESLGIVASSTSKEFEGMTQHCLGTMKIVEGKQLGKGMCKWTDPAGNTFVGEWEMTGGGEGTWLFLSGTGKFKGIKGSGHFQYLTKAKPIVEGTSQACRRDKGTFTTASSG